MDAQALLREGKLDEAVQALGDFLRDNPQDARSRTFLFELLCFRGDYERAGKHLAVLAQGGMEAASAASLYEGVLRCEEMRAGMFRDNDLPGPRPSEEPPVSGVLNGAPFQSIADADERIGPRLEVFAGGEYLWVPLRHIESLEIAAPTRLRNLLWAPAALRMGSGFDRQDLGQVLLPVLCPLSFQHPDPLVRLGRRTEWDVDGQDREIGFGQKTLLADGEEVPFLEIRSLQITQAEAVGE